MTVRRFKRSFPWGRTIGLVPVSIVLGGIFEYIACVGAGLAIHAIGGAFFGGIVGLLLSPALCWGLSRGPLIAGLALVSLPTAIGTYLGSLYRAPNDLPLLGLFISVTLYCGLSLAWGTFHWRRPWHAKLRVCPMCDYDLTGNLTGICPECGTRLHPQAAASANLAGNDA